MTDLKSLWGKLLGTIPGDAQFDYWGAMHSPETIRHGILKTAQKNLSVGSTIDLTGDFCTRWNERESTWRKSWSCQCRGTSQSKS